MTNIYTDEEVRRRQEFFYCGGVFAGFLYCSGIIFILFDKIIALGLLIFSLGSLGFGIWRRRKKY